MTHLMNMLNKLKEIGFKEAGEWGKNGLSLELHLKEFSKNKNILYAFICNGEVKYIGKTVQTLYKRLMGYKNPGKTQSTNIKNNSNILKQLENEISVKIFALPDNGLIKYRGFHLNLAAGLESSLIAGLNPEWNDMGVGDRNLKGDDGNKK